MHGRKLGHQLAPFEFLCHGLFCVEASFNMKLVLPGSLLQVLDLLFEGILPTSQVA